jgi:hypothetical protein
MLKMMSSLLVAIFSILLFPLTCYGTREFKVYPASTAVEGELEFSFWNNYTASNGQPYIFKGTPVSKSDLMEYSLEIEYGITDRFTVEGYADFEQPKGEPFQYVQTKAVLARYRLFMESEKAWDTSLYVEYALPQQSYHPSEEVEARLILEKAVGRWTIRLNPILSKNVSGPQVSEGMEFAYAAGVYWRNFHHVVAGLEFFGNIGELTSTPEHLHYLMPVVAINFGTGWKWEAGAGFGLTDESDRMILKNMISYSHLF